MVENNITKIYIASFHDIIIAVSQYKKPLNFYMQYHRRLLKENYTLAKEYYGEAYICNNFDDYILIPFGSYIIPKIDTEMISEDGDALHELLNTTITNLSTLTKVISHDKNIDDISSMIETVHTLKAYANLDSNFESLFASYQLNHPILNCDITEYIRLRKIYKEIRDNNREYRDICGLI